MQLIEKFQKNLKSQRLLRKLSQEQFADKANISTSYVSMLERGQRSPTLDTLEQLATALKVEPVSLLK